MHEEIEQIIKNKKTDIDAETLRYFTNYFYVLNMKGLIPQELDLESIIDNALYWTQKIVFYDDTYPIFQELGPDVKGKLDTKAKTLYVRNNLPEPLREITVYHELHHATQTNKTNGLTGLNQSEDVKGSLIMEAQTQYFAEEVYQVLHNLTFEEQEIPSESLNMTNDGTVVSSLHNYELYDVMLTKLAILLDVPKEFFVTINYLYENNQGLKILEQKYNEVAKKKGLPYTFESLLFALDYIYTVNFMAYRNNSDKAVILSGGTTTNGYFIHGKEARVLSLQNQRELIDQFDRSMFLALFDNGYDYEQFGKYVVSNNMRKIVAQIVGEGRS